jgi:hypothetical protein
MRVKRFLGALGICILAGIGSGGMAGAALGGDAAIPAMVGGFCLTGAFLAWQTWSQQ